MIWDEQSAHTFIASEIEWDSEPALTQVQQLFLLGAARVDDAYTIESLGAVIYLGLSWKLSKAMELHAKDESKIFEHIKSKLSQWVGFADLSLSASFDQFELLELEVGVNFG